MSDNITTTREHEIALNIADVQAAIDAACQHANRNPADVKLIAVTKQHTASEILAAINAGVQHIGENRLEEATTKIPTVLENLPDSQPPPVIHMIGHVQSRKARETIQYFDVIHSLDSLKLAQRYNNFVQECGKSPQIFLQINISGEDSKYGIPANQWETDTNQRQNLWEFVSEIQNMSAISTVGLMTMAPYYANLEQTRPVFHMLRQLRDALANDFSALIWDELSMGMTNDYIVAIEEGATMVRVGRAIFGERNT